MKRSTGNRPIGRRVLATALTLSLSLLGDVAAVRAQSVCLPLPRLLTTMPMGGTVGSQVETTITGEHLDDAAELVFTDPHLTATPKRDANGQPEPNKYIVSIAADCPPGVYEARVMTRLGMSSSRIFSVGQLPEVVRTQPNTSLVTAMQLRVNSVCNAVMTPRAADYYWFEGRQGQRIVVECASRGIDSKLEAVLVIGDAKGADLVVERRGGLLDFTLPADGKYTIKVHELTFGGGPAFFYRLVLQELSAGAPIVRHPRSNRVSSFSWPPEGLAAGAVATEVEPNNIAVNAQAITLPCDIAGSFAKAADVDLFEFNAKKGEVWWVEVASERLGRPTDPAVLVQRVERTEGAEKLIDVAEFNDIVSPIKVSSNGYSYDGPPYDAGSPDVLGKLEIPADGSYRLQLTDLYGGTRNDPSNVYRLVIRQAAPDFALVAWPLHMELRNGDRNALSKPLALRGGSTVALEVIVLRRDGFNEEIQVGMDGLPPGVTAQGLKIPAGQSRGILLVTAHQDAPRGVTHARFFGTAPINGTPVTRRGSIGTMAWPIPESWSEIPSPRLDHELFVSVGGSDYAPLTVAPAGLRRIEAAANDTVKVALAQVRRCEFSGSTMQLKAFGAGFESLPPFDVSLTADVSETTIDLAKLKLAPGDHVVSFYGSAVAKYRHHPEAVTLAAAKHDQTLAELKSIQDEAVKLTEQLKAAASDQTADIQSALTQLDAKKKTAEAAVAMADQALKRATEIARPTDLVDIVVTEPLTIHIKPVEAK